MTSTGKVLSASTEGSVNASLFKVFLIKLKQFIQEYEEIDFDQWIIMMDNAATHRSKVIYEYFKDNDMKVVYIPPYMTELAPIKRLLSILKHLVLRNSKGKLVNLKLNEADKMISKSIRSIDAWTVQMLSHTFVSELDSTIYSIFQNAKLYFIYNSLLNQCANSAWGLCRDGRRNWFWTFGIWNTWNGQKFCDK